jgi:hypothetical protein
MDQEQIGELLAAISNTLEKDFGVDIRKTPANVASSDGSRVQKVVLVGASILKRAAGHITADGLEVIDLCVPGWTLTPESVVEMAGKIQLLNTQEQVVFVLDLFGNSIYRYIDFDGTVSRPYKREGHYHMPGEVTVVSEEVQRRLIEMATPILDAIAGKHCIVMAPAPRYLFSKCCDNKAHCTNVGTEGHPEHFLKEVMAMRKVLKSTLVPGSQGKIWISDTCEVLQSPAGLTANERGAALREVSASDGVHFKEIGYSNMAANIIRCTNDIADGTIGNSTCKKNLSAGRAENLYQYGCLFFHLLFPRHNLLEEAQRQEFFFVLSLHLLFWTFFCSCFAYCHRSGC